MPIECTDSRPITMKIDFDAELTGYNGEVRPVYCNIQLPYVAGQKSLIELAIPSKHISEDVPESPCVLSGTNGYSEVCLEGVHWRCFPTSSNCELGLNSIDLLHVDKATIRSPLKTSAREVRFHLSPVAYLRSKSNCISFNNKFFSEDLFVLNLPEIGVTRFIVEWVTEYYQNTQNPGATVQAGFGAIANLPNEKSDINEIVAKFKKYLTVLSILFRQSVYVNGWTYNSESQEISTWIAPLDPQSPPSSREERGERFVSGEDFLKYSEKLASAYEAADSKIQSLVRHCSLAVNPYNVLRSGDHFLLMFSAFERVVEYAWRNDKTPRSQSVTTPIVIDHIERLVQSIKDDGGEDSLLISSRLAGLVGVINSPSFRDKLESFFRVYPSMMNYCADLWPISGTLKERGIREIRHALAHGGGGFISVEVVAVAKWHLEILLERIVFILLNIAIPEAILPNSQVLAWGARGWYERSWWVPLRSEPDQPI